MIILILQVVTEKYKTVRWTASDHDGDDDDDDEGMKEYVV